MAAQFSIEGYYFRHIDAFLLSHLPEFASIYRNGTVHQIFLLFFTGTYRHSLYSKRISIVSLIFKVCSGIHRNVAHLRLPVIDWDCILDIDEIPRSFPFAHVKTLFKVRLIGVLHAFLVDLVDAVIDVAMHEALHFMISTTLIQILFCIYFILRGFLGVQNLFSHILLQ